MPRYFFDIDDGTGTRDEEGLVLADLTAAKDMAARTLGEMAVEALPGNGPQKDLIISVRNEAGRRVLRVTVSFAAEIIP